jgi:alkylation response protein AidB-like acyl-CoA dehydrogenase
MLPQLATGHRVAGVAFTHLRRPGPPPVAATRHGTGWRLTGQIDWLTSWGLADVFLVGAQSGTDVVWCLVPLHRRAGVEAAPLALAAMAGTSTVQVRLDDVEVAPEEVVLVEPLERWRTDDAARTTDASPAVFGVTAEAVRHLGERPEPAARQVAAAAGRELDELRAAAYELADNTPAGERMARRLELRADAHALACRVTAALVASGGGRSMLLDAPAQRLARVALFLLVQGQSAAVRETTLARFSAAHRPQ